MQGNVNIPDSTITSTLSFRQLVLMNMQQLTNFPYIEKDFDALTDYELLCLVVKYLNDVIANQNEQNNSITSMYESFLALQTYVNNTKNTLEDAFNNLDDYVRNYFDNLDVQEEINNKLDKMLEDGVLEQIIEQFIQSTALWCFDTVADMKVATNLINGSYAKTLGYYDVNDGGAAIYKITDSASLTEYQEELGSNLYATLIIENYVIPDMYGAYGDGETDDSTYIQLALNSGYDVKFNGNKTYYIETGLIVNNDIIVDGNNCTLKVNPSTTRRNGFLVTANATIKNFIGISEEINPFYLSDSSIFNDVLSSNVIFVNIRHDNVIVNNIKTNYIFNPIGFSRQPEDDTTIFKNCHISNIIGNNVQFGLFYRYCEDITTNNCKITASSNFNSYCHDIYVCSNCKNIIINDVECNVNDNKALDIISIHPSSLTTTSIENITLNNCIVNSNLSDTVDTSNSSIAIRCIYCKNIYVNNLKVNGDINTILTSVGGTADNVIFKNCYFKGSSRGYGGFAYAAEGNNATNIKYFNCVVDFIFYQIALILNIANIELYNCKINTTSYDGTSTQRYIQCNNETPINNIIIENCNITGTKVEGARLSNTSTSKYKFIGNIIESKTQLSKCFYGTPNTSTYYISNTLIGYTSIEENSGTATETNNTLINTVL